VTGVTALASHLKLSWVSLSECEVDHADGFKRVSARKRKAQAQTQTDIIIVLVCFIIILVNLLLFVDQGFAKALELMGQLGS